MAKAPKLDVPDAIHAMSSDKALPLLAKAAGGKCLVSFSGGKDSVGAVLALREHFPELELFFLYRVPNMRICEEGLQYYEDLWGQRIHRFPHPATVLWLRDMVYQDPSRTFQLRERRDDLKMYDYDDLAEWLLEELGWPSTTPMAVGVRAIDSIFRRAALRKCGIYNTGRNVIYPIFDWSQQQLVDALDRTGTKLGPDYRIFGRSFDGVDYRFIAPLREHYPDDWERLKLWFPMLGAEIARYEFSERRAARATWRR